MLHISDARLRSAYCSLAPWEMLLVVLGLQRFTYCFVDHFSALLRTFTSLCVFLFLWEG